MPIRQNDNSKPIILSEHLERDFASMDKKELLKGMDAARVEFLPKLQER